MSGVIDQPIWILRGEMSCKAQHTVCHNAALEGKIYREWA